MADHGGPPILSFACDPKDSTMAPPQAALPRRAGLLMSLATAALVATVASAGPRDDALAALAAGDLKTAKKSLATLDAHLGNKKKLVRAEVLSRRYLTEALYHKAREKQDDMLMALRQACLVHPDSDPDLTIIGNGEMVDMYYAVCGEVEQRPEVDIASLKLPDAPIRIDGVIPGEEFPLRQGRHLVQVECANGNWSTRWSELTRAEDWGERCPGGKLADAEAPISDDIMPAFLSGGEDLGDDEMLDDEMPDDEMPVDEVAVSTPPAAATAPVETPVEAPAAASVEAGAAAPSARSSSDQKPSGQRLLVDCAPTPCSVSVNGKDIGKSPLETHLESGDYDLSLKAGPNSMTRKISLATDHPTTTVQWDHNKLELKVDQPRTGK